MTIRAAFIGIDRFNDPKIRDLQGARRDAEALWALFTDSLSGLQAQLLVDHQATAAAVRQALDDTLASAGPEDTVVLSFAGHGSRDHHFIVRDSVKGGLPQTAIPMEDLARRRFRMPFVLRSGIRTSSPWANPPATPISPPYNSWGTAKAGRGFRCTWIRNSGA